MLKKQFDIFGNRILNVLFWTVLIAAVVAVAWRADFVFGDEELFLRTICRGITIPLQVFPASGRCYPLSHWDCNFVLLLPQCLRADIPLVIYAAKSVVLSLTLLVLAQFLIMSNPTGWIERTLAFLTVVAFVMAPSVMLVSCWNIFPEQRMFFLLAIFLLSVYRGVAGGSALWHGLAALAALAAFGYKETSFVLVGVFAVSCLLGGWRRFATRERVVFLSLTCLAIAYCLMYYFVFVGKTTASYQAEHKIGVLQSALFYLKQPELSLAMILALVRGLFFVRGRSGRHLLWDAMLFAGVAFVLAYVALQMTSIYNYYQSPAYVFLLPVFLHWIAEAARRFRHGGLVGFGVLSCLIAYNVWHTVPAVLCHLERRRVEMPVVRSMASDGKLKHIYYYHPAEGLYENYHRYLFGLYLEYAGCKVQLEDVQELRKELVSGEMEIVPTYPYLLNEPSAVQTEWFTIVKGPIKLDRPRPCGRDGVVVRAGDFGVEGLYTVVEGSAWAGQKVSFRMELDQSLRGRSMELTLFAGAVITPKYPKNTITVRVDGESIGCTEDAWPPHRSKFVVPASMTDRPVIAITIESGRAIRPADEGINADLRWLGLYFTELMIRPRESEK